MTRKELGDEWMQSIACRLGLYATIETTKGGITNTSELFSIEIGKLIEENTKLKALCKRALAVYDQCYIEPDTDIDLNVLFKELREV